MTDAIYRRLATRVNEIPNGFPATESGVELRLLAKMFTPDEAALASVMRLTSEPADGIALRADVDEKVAFGHLQAMAVKGLIMRRTSEDGVAFSLKPFIVGFYEAWLPRMDEEYAALFEAYFQETRAGILRDGPSVHRVIPVEVAIPFEVEIFPYERATAMLDRAKSWGVRDCICRVQKRLIGEACDHPVENCLILAPVENAFEGSQDIRPLTKEEALVVLREAEEAGLIHSSGNYRRGNSYICNLHARRFAPSSRPGHASAAETASIAVSSERCRCRTEWRTSTPMSVPAAVCALPRAQWRHCISSVGRKTRHRSRRQRFCTG